MSLQNRGLGRGLDALFNGRQSIRQSSDTDVPYITVPPDALTPNPMQPRSSFAEEGLRELAESIREQGILQPLLVRPLPQSEKYEIIAGERRWRAAMQVGLQQVPVIVKNFDDNQTMIAGLIENIQREDLNPMEVARCMDTLKNALGLSQDGLADKIGKPRGTVSNIFRLLRLNAAAQEDLLNNRITARHARCLLSLPEGAPVDELRERIIDNEMTVKETEDAVEFWRANSHFPWDTSDAAAQTGQEDGKNTDRQKFVTDPEIKRLAKQIGATLKCRTQIRGSSEKGRISLSYESNAQLYELLEKLGLSLVNIT